MADCFIAPFIDTLSNHTPLYYTLSNICTPSPCIDENTPVIEPKTQWNAAPDEQISRYKSELDSLLSAFSLPPDIAKCESDFCSHQNEISMFHDKIISSTTKTMHLKMF